jgi:hypothetical protein
MDSIVREGRDYEMTKMGKELKTTPGLTRIYVLKMDNCGSFRDLSW